MATQSNYPNHFTMQLTPTVISRRQANLCTWSIWHSLESLVSQGLIWPTSQPVSVGWQIMHVETPISGTRNLQSLSPRADQEAPRSMSHKSPLDNLSWPRIGIDPLVPIYRSSNPVFRSVCFLFCPGCLSLWSEFAPQGDLEDYHRLGALGPGSCPVHGWTGKDRARPYRG